MPQQNLEEAIQRYENAVTKSEWLLAIYLLLKFPLSVQGWPVWPPLPGFSDFSPDVGDAYDQIVTLSRAQTDGWVTDVSEAIPV